MKLDRITFNPNKMNRQPCIRDMRLTVWRVLDILQTYPDRIELHREYPYLTEEDIEQAIIYANTHPKELITATSIAHETSCLIKGYHFQQQSYYENRELRQFMFQILAGLGQKT